MRLARALAAGGTAAVVGLLAPGTASAATGLPDPSAPRPTVATAAKVYVYREGQQTSFVAFRVWSGNGTGITATNLAYARAWCTRCRAVSVSLQVVVQGHVPGLDTAQRSPVVRLRNLARADTSGYRGVAVARAYQLVALSRHQLTLTSAARTQLTGIERRMRQVAAGPGTAAQLTSRLDALAAEATAVVRRGVVQAAH